MNPCLLNCAKALLAPWTYLGIRDDEQMLDESPVLTVHNVSSDLKVFMWFGARSSRLCFQNLGSVYSPLWTAGLTQCSTSAECSSSKLPGSRIFTLFLCHLQYTTLRIIRMPEIRPTADPAIVLNRKLLCLNRRSCSIFDSFRIGAIADCISVPVRVLIACVVPGLGESSHTKIARLVICILMNEAVRADQVHWYRSY